MKRLLQIMFFKARALALIECPGLGEFPPAGARDGTGNGVGRLAHLVAANHHAVVGRERMLE
jgi:hypothetical protein